MWESCIGVEYLVTYNTDIFRMQLDKIKKQGLTKPERIITTPQNVRIDTTAEPDVINFCANNYLGLADHAEVIQAAKDALDQYGFGLASVRFICGTQVLHKTLEHDIGQYLGKESVILYSSCFDANTGLFETLFGADDAIISDALNHASVIDGIRLCKAERYRYKHSDMEDLETQLKQAQSKRFRVIATDGVFSMDGDIAKLDQIVRLAEKYSALLMVDDSHATGVIGAGGRGSAEYHGVLDKVDIITSTLGKALGGGSGGFTAASADIIALLRQRSRPYLFSNTLAPAMVGGCIKAVELASQTSELRDQLIDNTKYFREQIVSAGFEIKQGEHPIVPVMLHDAVLAQKMAARLLEKGIYVIGFSFPVVPQGEARIRVQLSAKHTKAQLNQAIQAFTQAGRELAVI